MNSTVLKKVFAFIITITCFIGLGTPAHAEDEPVSTADPTTEPEVAEPEKYSDPSDSIDDRYGLPEETYLHVGESKTIELHCPEGVSIQGTRFGNSSGSIDNLSISVDSEKNTITMVGKQAVAASMYVTFSDGKTVDTYIGIADEIQSVSLSTTSLLLTKPVNLDGKAASFDFMTEPYSSTNVLKIDCEVLDTNIARVEQSSPSNFWNVYPLSAGKTQIKATYTDMLTGKADVKYIDVTVLEGSYANTITTIPKIKMKIGDSINLDEMIRSSYLEPKNADYSDEKITYSCTYGSNNVEFTDEGTVKAKRSGIAYAMAKLTNGYSASFQILIEADISSISFSQSEIGYRQYSTDYVSNPLRNYLVSDPSNGLDYSKLTWESSDTNILSFSDAEMDSDGVPYIKASSEGECTVTVTYPGLEPATVKIHTYLKEPTFTDMEVPDSVSMKFKDIMKITPKLAPVYKDYTRFTGEVVQGEDIVSLETMPGSFILIKAKDKAGTAKVKIYPKTQPELAKEITVTVSEGKTAPELKIIEDPQGYNKTLSAENGVYTLKYGEEYDFGWTYKNAESSKDIDEVMNPDNSKDTPYSNGYLTVRDGIVLWDQLSLNVIPSKIGTFSMNCGGLDLKFKIIGEAKTVDAVTDNKSSIDNESVQNTQEKLQETVIKAISQNTIDTMIKEYSEGKGKELIDAGAKLDMNVYLKSEVTSSDNSVSYDIKPILKIRTTGGQDGYVEEKEIQVDQPVEMELVTGDTFDSSIKKVWIKHVKEDGTVYVYEGTHENGVVRFTNPHGFSTFTITAEKPEIVEPTPTPTPSENPSTPGAGTGSGSTTTSGGASGSGSTSTGNTSSGTTTPSGSGVQTGVHTNVAGFAGVAAVAIVLGTAVLVFKKKYQ